MPEIEAINAEDEPIPEPTASVDGAAADAGLAEAVDGGLTWVPFAALLGAWLALSGASGYLLRAATTAQPARWLPAYPALVLAGLVLAALGPVVSLAVWLVARSRRGADGRAGLLASALVRGAVVTFFGALIWVVTLFITDVMTVGSIW